MLAESVTLSATPQELPEEYISELVPIVRRSVKAVLDRTAAPTTGPYSFERVFQACHVLVSLKDSGAKMYLDIKHGLEKCVDEIFRDLTSSPRNGMQWLAHFVEQWHWFEARVVN